MAYCTAADIAVELEQVTFDGSTRPTSTQVGAIIDQVDGKINLTLKRIGVVGADITGTDELNYLKQLSIHGATCRVGMTYFGNATTVDNTQPSFHCLAFRDELADLENLAEIFDGGLSLGVTVSNQVTDGTTTESEIDEMTIENEFEV